MTYMHMFRQYGDLTDGWDIFTRDVRRVLDAAFATDHIRFTGPDGVGNPVVDGDHISFNGSLRQFIMRDGRRVGSSDGPCDITRRAAQAWGGGFGFCATGRKPYDVAVAAVYTLAAERWPDLLVVGSDGAADDWSAGVALATRVVQRAVPVPAGVLASVDVWSMV